MNKRYREVQTSQKFNYPKQIQYRETPVNIPQPPIHSTLKRPNSNIEFISSNLHLLDIASRNSSLPRIRLLPLYMTNALTGIIFLGTKVITEDSIIIKKVLMSPNG